MPENSLFFFWADTVPVKMLKKESTNIFFMKSFNKVKQNYNNLINQFFFIC